ncbi:MAG: VanZ family protein [Bacteroidetes bacterium]|nr:VanZ family protein [Bacteroidota bacterium]MBS1940135.1 VanZ family protein [Bacteroidota bacterium]
MKWRSPVLWAVLWALGILVLTLMPAGDVPAWPWAERVQLDKWVHAFLFGVQGVLLAAAFLQMRPGSHRIGLLVMATVLAIAYGGAVEVLQSLMGDGRQGDVLDLLADAAGALLGLLWMVRRK